MLIKTRINNEQKYVKISEPCLDEFLDSAFQKFCISPVSEGVRVYDETGTEVDADVFEEVVQQPNAGVFTIRFDNDVNGTSVFTDTFSDSAHCLNVESTKKEKKRPSTLTTPVRKEKILKDHLDDLTDRELETFQWLLARNQREGCRSILRSQLQGANREETVDVLVQFYGEDGAVETTADIFMRMNRNDLVSQLVEAILDPSTDQPSTSAAVRQTNRNLPSTSTNTYIVEDGDLLSSFRASTWTTPVRKDKILKDHLEELTDRELETFQWRLVYNETEGCRSILRSRLQEGNREQTVDVLVQVYGEDDAVQITADIFRTMNRNDLVSQLEAILDPPEDQASALRETDRDLDSTCTDNISCPICKCVFTDPVVLLCGHSFCRACVQRHWHVKISQKCPVCQQVHRVREPPINYALQSLIETRDLVDPSGGHRNDSESQQISLIEEEEDSEEDEEACGSSSTESRDTENSPRMCEINEMSRVLSTFTFSVVDMAKEMENSKADNPFKQIFTTAERLQKDLRRSQKGEDEEKKECPIM